MGRVWLYPPRRIEANDLFILYVLHFDFFIFYLCCKQNSGLSDFAEDPFKDYRYEDPFSIQDPFADSEGNLSKKKSK